MRGLGRPLALFHERSEGGMRLPPELYRLYGGDIGLTGRCLYANFVATVDGVVAIPSLPDSNRLISGDSAADRFVMGLLRACADLVLVGSGTLRASARGRWRPETVFPPAAEAYAALRRRLGLAAQPRVAILTASGSIPPDRAVLEDGPIVLTTAVGSGRLAGTLPDGVEIVTLPGETEVDLRSAVELLRERGHGRILSEAGPHVFGSLVAADLVDDLFLTVSPLLAGRLPAGHLGLVEGVALLPERARRARLRSVRAHADHLFLHYALREPVAT
jgi:riboflavin biosynthesis pyrimidine reductase